MNRPEPVAHAHRTNFNTYDEAQRWAYRLLGEPQFDPIHSPNITVSLTRTATGGWTAYVYGWPSVPDVHTEDVPGLDGAPMIYAGEPTGPSAGRTILDETHVFLASQPLQSAVRGAMDAQAAADRRRVMGEPTMTVVDLGDVASGRVRIEPLPPEAMGSFVVPTPDPALVADTPTMRVPVVPGPYDRAGAASVYEDPRPLTLDLDTEEPAPVKETGRERRRREALARAHEAAGPVTADDVAAGNRVLAEQSYTVPASGHRPDDAGVEPVSYPKCVSTIAEGGERFTCKRSHDPRSLPLGRVHSDRPGRSWRGDDPRIVKQEVPDGSA